MTHFGKFKYAIDLAIPEGTNIICPRDGICIDYQDEYSESGKIQSFENKTNYLTILHEDGSISEYVHLERNGVFSRIGDVIKYGQFIAKSGNTGWSYGPHLHFHVRKSANKDSETIYVRFDDESKKGISLKQGKFYY